MAETIPGGATVNVVGTGRAQKEIWVDANGDPLDEDQIAEAKQRLAERAQELEQANQVRLEQDAQKDPTARAIASLMVGARQAGARAVAEPASRPSMQPSGKKGQASSADTDDADQK